jgi:hypothetical protein
MAKIIVTSNLPENRVAIWDRDKAHKPDGEIYLTGGQTAEVADTAGVRQALREGRLIQLSEFPEPAKTESEETAKSEAKTSKDKK